MPEESSILKSLLFPQQQEWGLDNYYPPHPFDQANPLPSRQIEVYSTIDHPQLGRVLILEIRAISHGIDLTLMTESAQKYDVHYSDLGGYEWDEFIPNA